MEGFVIISFDGTSVFRANVTDKVAISTYDYDQLNQLIKKSYEDAKGAQSEEDVLYAYNAMGERVAMTDAIGEASYSYDALGRITKAVDSAGKQVTYSYDENGNVAEIGYPDGTSVSYEYDLNDNLIQVTDRDGAVTMYSYDALNRMVKTTRPNGIVSDVIYDAMDHVTGITTSCGECNEVLSAYSYRYNEQGYIIHETATESLAGYVYDDKHDGKHEDGKHDSEYPHGNKHNGKHDKDGDGMIRVVKTERDYEYDENWQLTKCTEIEENKSITTYVYQYDTGVTIFIFGAATPSTDKFYHVKRVVVQHLIHVFLHMYITIS